MNKQVQARIRALTRKAQMRGDGCCGQFMDAFGIQRCPENYRKIMGILADYRKLLRKLNAASTRSAK